MKAVKTTVVASDPCPKSAGKTEAASTEPPETVEKFEDPAETKNADEPQEIVYHD